MSEVKNKRILKEIAKRFAKSMIARSEPLLHFENSGLEYYEIAYIEECLKEIADRITNKPEHSNTAGLVAEYFKFENE